MNNEIHTILAELQSIYKWYEPMWEKWQNYPHCGLSNEDVYILSVQKKQNFSYKTGDELMYYNRHETINTLLQKLNQNYSHYQEWAIMKFWFALIRRLNTHLLDTYFDMPFDELPLSPKETELLKKFGVGSINKLIQKYTDADLQQPALFELVLQIYSSHSPSKTIAA